MDGSSALIVETITIIVVVLMGLAALVGGAVITLRAVRNAPDGFEDHEGFHLGEIPPAARRK